MTVFEDKLRARKVHMTVPARYRRTTVEMTKAERDALADAVAFIRQAHVAGASVLDDRLGGDDSTQVDADWLAAKSDWLLRRLDGVS